MISRGGEMVYAGDLKSPGRNPMRVRVPPSAFQILVVSVGWAGYYQHFLALEWSRLSLLNGYQLLFR